MTWRHSKDAFSSKQTEVHSPNTCRGKKNCDFTFWNEYRHIFHKYLLEMKIFQQLICELIRNKMVETLVENYMWHQVLVLSRVWLFATLAPQVPLSMGFSRQEYWIGLPFPSPVDFPDPGVELASPILQADSLPLSHTRHKRHKFYSPGSNEFPIETWNQTAECLIQ